MTREEAKANAAVMLAWAEGKTIQLRLLHRPDDGWSDSGISKHWIFDFKTEEYRIKPEPREWWIVRDVGCGTVPYCFNSHERARATATAGALPDARELIHVREVL